MNGFIARLGLVGIPCVIRSTAVCVTTYPYNHFPFAANQSRLLGSMLNGSWNPIKQWAAIIGLALIVLITGSIIVRILQGLLIRKWWLNKPANIQ